MADLDNSNLRAAVSKLELHKHFPHGAIRHDPDSVSAGNDIPVSVLLNRLHVIDRAAYRRVANGTDQCQTREVPLPVAAR